MTDIAFTHIETLYDAPTWRVAWAGPPLVGLVSASVAMSSTSGSGAIAPDWQGWLSEAPLAVGDVVPTGSTMVGPSYFYSAGPGFVTLPLGTHVGNVLPLYPVIAQLADPTAAADTNWITGAFRYDGTLWAPDACCAAMLELLGQVLLAVRKTY